MVFISLRPDYISQVCMSRLYKFARAVIKQFNSTTKTVAAKSRRCRKSLYPRYVRAFKSVRRINSWRRRSNAHRLYTDDAEKWFNWVPIAMRSREVREYEEELEIATLSGGLLELNGGRRELLWEHESEISIELNTKRTKSSFSCQLY